ncbi:MAG: HAD-IIA family hydrolase [Eubacteriales bacterium]
MYGLENKKGFICDMDGVLYHGNTLLPGVREFHDWLTEHDKKYIFLTNSSERSPRELQQKLDRLGLDVDESHFYTSALATAKFLKSQCPEGSVYVIGEPGLLNALYDVGFTMNNVNPDYVVVGETRALNYEMIEHATILVQNGAQLIGTNPDITAPTEKGIIPATRALISPIEMASGRKAYFLGKPNPLMMRIGLSMLGVENEDACIVGDRMDTDIIAGIESEIDTILVLSGVTDIDGIQKYPYRPKYVLHGVGEIMAKEIL